MPIKLTAILIIAVLMAGCGSEKRKSGSDELSLSESEIDAGILEDINSAKQIFYSLKSVTLTEIIECINRCNEE